jgi:hypothetical protein
MIHRLYTLPEPLREVMVSPDPGLLEARTRTLYVALHFGRVAAESAECQGATSMRHLWSTALHWSNGLDQLFLCCGDPQLQHLTQ